MELLDNWVHAHLRSYFHLKPKHYAPLFQIQATYLATPKMHIVRTSKEIQRNVEHVLHIQVIYMF